MHNVLPVGCDGTAIGHSRVGHWVPKQVVDIEGHVGSWGWVSPWLDGVTTACVIEEGRGIRSGPGPVLGACGFVGSRGGVRNAQHEPKPPSLPQGFFSEALNVGKERAGISAWTRLPASGCPGAFSREVVSEQPWTVSSLLGGADNGKGISK